jgi:phenylalanyl-tRNA synthetase beta chain
MLENAAWNLNRGLDGVHIYELGNVFGWHDDKHCEELRLGLLTSGLLPGTGWASAPAETDFFALKGALEAVMEALRFEPVGFEERDHPYFEAGRALALTVKGQEVGRLGALRADLAAAASIERTVYAAEINLAALFEKTPRPFEVAPVPKFPGVARDLSFLVGRAVPYLRVARVLDKLNQPLLEGFELRDRFAGAPLPEDKVSLTFRFRFRHPRRTLVAEEVDRVEQEIVGQLRSALDVQLREA